MFFTKLFLKVIFIFHNSPNIQNEENKKKPSITKAMSNRKNKQKSMSAPKRPLSHHDVSSRFPPQSEPQEKEEEILYIHAGLSHPSCIFHKSCRLQSVKHLRHREPQENEKKKKNQPCQGKRKKKNVQEAHDMMTGAVWTHIPFHLHPPAPWST